MIIKANNLEIPVSGIISDKITAHGKSYPALRIEFSSGVTEEQLSALCSGVIEILDDNGKVIGVHEGYTTRRGLSFVVGKIEVAEQQRDELAAALAIEEAKKPYINALIVAIDDKTALSVIPLFPTWEDCVELGSVESPEGFRFSHNGKLYKCKNPNPAFQSDWIPGNGTESIYERIDEEHMGTIDDPIPYDGNMVLVNGLYYTQDGVTYLCTRDSGNALYNKLVELVGHYVELA